MPTSLASRRAFLRWTSLAAAIPLLAGCAAPAVPTPTLPPAKPTTAPSTPTSAPAPAPTAPTVPTAAPTAAPATRVPTAAPATSAPTAAPATSAPTAAPTAPARGAGPTKLTGAPVPLVIYVAIDYGKAVATAFEQDTGVPAQLVEDSTGQLLAKIQAEKNNPQWGLLWIDGVEAMAGLDGQDLLLRGYVPDVPWNEQGKALLPKSAAYIPTGLTATGAIAYDTRAVPTPPTSWEDLLKPEWKGKVGMNNPSISGPTYPLVAGLMDQMGGEEKGKAFFTQLKANGLKVYNKNGNTLHALEIGEIKVALVQSTVAINASIKTPTVKVALLPGIPLLPSAVGIGAKSSSQVQTEAKMLVEYLLSAKGQEIAQNAAKQGDSLFWPLVNGPSVPREIPPLANLKGHRVDPYVWGPRQGAINQWFTDNIVP